MTVTPTLALALVAGDWVGSGPCSVLSFIEVATSVVNSCPRLFLHYDCS